MNILDKGIITDITGQNMIAISEDLGGITNIITSSDYGITWSTGVYINTNNLIYDISANSNLQSIVVASSLSTGSPCHIYRSTDGGLSFQPLNNSPISKWYTITSDSTGQYLVAGQNSGGTKQICRSQDSGEHWTNANVVDLFWYKIISSKDGKHVIAYGGGTGSRNYIKISSNYGVDFTDIDDPINDPIYVNTSSNPGIFDITCDNTGQYIYVAMLNYGIYKSSTFGKSWEKTSAISTNPGYGVGYNSISCDATGKYILALDYINSDTYYSSNYGLTWEKQNIPGTHLQGAGGYVSISGNSEYRYSYIAGNDDIIRLFSLNVPVVACFTAGSPILTPDGYKNVEDFKVGDDVLTSDGKVVPINVYTTTLVTTVETAPYRILANTFEEGVPKNNLCLSPYHAIKIGKDMWQVPVRAAEIYKSKISQYDVGKEITYYHLETPNYMSDHLICDGTVVESYAGDQMINKNKNIYAYQPLLLAYNRMNLSQPIMI
jgi:hypothetical protein